MSKEIIADIERRIEDINYSKDYNENQRHLKTREAQVEYESKLSCLNDEKYYLQSIWNKLTKKLNG
jgi:hypothetical protein